MKYVILEAVVLVNILSVFKGKLKGKRCMEEGSKKGVEQETRIYPRETVDDIYVHVNVLARLNRAAFPLLKKSPFIL